MNLKSLTRRDIMQFADGPQIFGRRERPLHARLGRPPGEALEGCGYLS